MEDEPEAKPGKSRSRKRETFLEILRRHPEELRPWSTKPVLHHEPAPVFSTAAG
jgi:hypothetical protein